GAGSGSAAPAPAPVADEIIGQGVSAKDGYLTVSDLPTGTPLVLELTTNGQTVRSSPFTLPASGGSQIMLRINWQQRGNLQAIFNNVPDGATTVYYLETEWRKAKVRSLPFQVVDGRGTTASLLLYPRLLFRFQLDAWVEDDFLAVQGDYILRNYSWFPYTGGEDGINIPLPHGFKGAIVDRDKDVAKDASGFHVLRPLPPFEFKFRGGFSMAIGSDTISWDQPAPLGIYQSDLAIRLLPGMSAIPPTIPNVDAGEVAEGTTKFYAIQKITLPPSRPDAEPASLQFSITGLPSQPAWKVWAPRAVGVLVLLALAIAAFVALSAEARKNKLAKSSTAERSARVEALYDELAAIDPDATGELAARRAALYAELERLVANERA
ncbi:MAG: hypothetical protein K8R60_09640, partial [Burkholderiales bacterium]|nr:hypothetical protein [Burkholderiales bacterium]